FGKVQPLGAALVGQLILGALAALVYVIALGEEGPALGSWPGRRERTAAVGLSGALWLIAVTLFWPVLPENLLGYPVGQSRAVTVLGLAGTFAVYGLVLAVVYHALTAQSTQDGAEGVAVGPDRRRLLARSAVVAAAGLAVGSVGLDVLVRALLARSTLS